MTTEQVRYSPTLWRTCRALMNQRRLRCLTVVLAKPGLCVKDIAEETGLPENQACVNLRSLQARGLISSYRDGVNIRYSAHPDHQVEHASTILNAIQKELTANNGIEKSITLLRAFTHARRLSILRLLLQHQEISFEKIAQLTFYSQPAISRHVTVLHSAGVVELSDNGLLRLLPAPKRPKLVQALLACIA